MIKRYAIWDLKAEAFTATTVSMSIDSQVKTLCIRVFDTKERAELAIKSAVYKSDPRYHVRMIGTSDVGED
jgi:hypothetical protein